MTANLNRNSITTATSNRTSLFKNNTAVTLAQGSYQRAPTPKAYTDTYTGTATQPWTMIIASWKPKVTTEEGTPTVTTTTTYTHTDHLGGTNAVTDNRGNVVETLDYYPYGETRIDEKARNYTGEKRKYIGEYADDASGLSYLNARYYNGKEGRFLSEDPVFLAMGNKDQVSQLTGQKLPVILTDPQQLNSYSYARNNPTTYLDKNGNFAFLALVVVYAPEIMAGLTAVTGTAFLSSQMADSISTMGNKSATLGDKAFAVMGLAVPGEGKAANYSVYVGKNADEVIEYVGITMRNPVTRAQEHLQTIGSGRELLKYTTQLTDLAKNEARQIEQSVINFFGMQKNGGQLLNKINSIAPQKQIPIVGSIVSKVQSILTSANIKK